MISDAHPAPEPPRVSVQRFAGHGVTLAADVAGPDGGPTVILTHGAGQTRQSWARAVRDLAAQGFHVISLDARGHGESDWAPDGNYTGDALAADLRAVIATRPDQPALVGASMGGATSLTLIGDALRAGAGSPARALVMVDVAPRIEAAGSAHIHQFMSAHLDGFDSLEQVADAVAAYNPNRPRPRDPSGLMRNLRRGDDGRLFWHWDPKFLRPRNPGALEAMTERLGRATEAVAAAHLPVLLVYGKQSDVVSAESVADFRRRMPQAEVIDIAGAGHMVAGDKNDVFAQAVQEFLRRHS